MISETVCVHEEIIWNNQKIIINGKPLFYKSWFEKNIIRVSDLLQKYGKFLSFKNFCNKYKLKIPFTLYFGLSNTISSSWKFAAKGSPRDFQKVRKQKKICPQKNVYKIMLKEIFVPPTAENKILRHGFSHETIHKVYELPFPINTDIKITMFQYTCKIIHNILTTRVSLFRAKICDNNICP